MMNEDEWVVRMMDRNTYFIRFRSDDRVRLVREKGGKPNVAKVLIQRKNLALLGDVKSHSITEFC